MQKRAFGILDKQLDVYEQMKRHIDNFQKTLESARDRRAVEKAEEAAQRRRTEDRRQTTEDRRQTTEDRRWTTEDRRQTTDDRRWTTEDRRQTTEDRRWTTDDEIRNILGTDVDVSAGAKGILGPHETFASFYALFAAGEYMSSALFLSRALEIFPEYARFKIDLVAMVGDRDKLESRIADVEEWLQRSGAPELQFLLGYVYYQMGRLQRAKQVIDAAYEKMPDSPAVIALKRAIDSAVKLDS
ncbi:hypothetical protein ES703_123919 [subsurface metagenome]